MMKYRNRSYVLIILILTNVTTQDNFTSNDYVTNDSVLVTTTTTNAGVTEHAQTTRSSHPGFTVRSASHTNVSSTPPVFSNFRPWDHITSYFRDFTSQVVALDLEFCGRACNFSHRLMAYTETEMCDYCSCDTNCEETRDCCPELVLLHNKTKNSINLGCVMNEHPATVGTKFYPMVNMCPESYNTSFIKTKCEEPPLTNWLNVIPRVNRDIWISFRNIYCAECNGQSNTNDWATSIICSSFDNTLQEQTSLMELFNATLRSKTCNLLFHPPVEVEKRHCRQRLGVIIGQCNVTGKWQTYDKKVENACGLYSHVVLGTYRNIFCYYCNNQVSWYSVLRMHEQPSVKSPVSVPLTALLNFDHASAYIYRGQISNVNPQYKLKDNGTMVKFMKECKNQSVSCAEGKQLHGDECRSLFASSNMYGYRVCFQINITLTEQVASTSDLEILVYYNIPQVNYTFIAMTNITGYVVELQNCPHKEMFVTIRYVMFIYSVLTLNRDQFEKQLMEDHTMILADSTDLFQYHAGCSSKPVLALRRGDEHHCTSRIIQFVWTESFPVAVTNKQIYSGAKYIQLSKQLSCPRIVLEVSEYATRTTYSALHSGKNISFLFPDLFVFRTQKLLEHDKFQMLDDGSVIICFNDYINPPFEKTYLCQDVTRPVTGSTNLGIFSFVCTSVSLLFLGITFGTYCMFASMRTLGGVCNMGLIATIFAAQAVYEFGMEQNENVIGCQVIGIVIHFLWLAAVFWMNACTFLLFLKLSFPLKCINLGYNRNKIFLLSALYSNTASALIVCINIIVNIVSSGDIGYGRTFCFLSTQFSKIYLFKVPMGIIVVVNIIIFVLTLCRIEHHHSVSSSRESKINLLACVKLSVITGLVWLFSYLYEVFQITVFAYLFTLFVGSQGVLFFLAIVLNRNVRILWFAWFERKTRNLFIRHASTKTTWLGKLRDTSSEDGHIHENRTLNTKM